MGGIKSLDIRQLKSPVVMVRPPFARGNIIALILLISNFCSLYGVIGVVTHIPSLILVSIGFGLVSLIYIAINMRIVLLVLSKSPVWITIVVGYILPILHIIVLYACELIALERVFYWIALNLSLAAIFVSAVVYGISIDRIKISKFFYLSLVIISIGFLLNSVDYSFTQKVLFYSSSAVGKSLSLARFMGFFGIANMAAFSILLGVFLVSVSISRISLRYVLFCVISAALIVLTESRTSMMMLVFVLVGVGGVKIARRPGNLLAVIFVAPVVLGGGLAALMATSFFGGGGGGAYVDRMTSMFVTLFADGGQGDVSTQLRIKAVSQFLHLISERPLTGYGPDAIIDMVSSGELVAVSQNSWLEWAAEYGILYPFSVSISFFALYLNEMRKSKLSVNGDFRPFAIRMILCVIIVSSFSIMDFFNIRSFVVVFGLVIGSFLRMVSINSDIRKNRGMPVG